MNPRCLRRAGAALLIAVATAATANAAPAASAAPSASASTVEAAAASKVATADGPACPEELSDIPASDFAMVNGVVPRPVVLVHGWDASAKSMQGYANLLKNSKVLHEPLEPFLFDYSANSGRWASIPAIAACLGAYVNRISAAYKNAGGDGKVLAVGHSMGGLAIRFSSSAQYAAQPDGAVLGGVVTIDTPHLGSPWGDTPQAQLLQDYAQLKAGNWLEGMFPWPIGSDGQTCLATHAGSTGMPPGCPTPPWLPADVPVAEIGGDITVQRQVMGYTIDTTNTGGDSVVAKASSLGYQPSSGPGTPPDPVVAPLTYTDGCQITTGQVEAGIGGYGISLLQAFESEVLALFSRPPGTSFWNSPLTQPVATFLSLANKFAPCAHTNINNPAADPFAALDVLNALNADIDRLNGEPAQAPVTSRELLSAPVPASCGHPSGRLVNGVLPGIPANHGFMQLGWLNNPYLSESAGTAFGDLDGTGTSDAAAVLSCNAGGVSWPDIIAFYGQGQAGLKLLSWAYITDFNLPGIQSQENGSIRQIRYQDGAIYAEWSTQDNGDPAAASTLDYSATLRLSGGKVIATNLVGVTERQTVLAFASDLRAGDTTAADALAAPGVAEQAASLFRSYPSALNAAPTCYGLGDIFSMPTPLYNLIDPGGPDQVNQETERLCAFPSTDPGAEWIALGMQRTGWRTWQVLWAQSA